MRPDALTSTVPGPDTSCSVSDPKAQASLSLFSRRNLLRGGLGGSVLLALGGVGLGLQGTRLGVEPAEALSVLTREEHAIVSAIAARLCPPAGPDVPGADAIGVGVLADRLLSRADPATAADVKSVLALFENGLTGALFLERVRPFTQLDPETQDAVLLAWRDSSVGLRRTVFRALSSLVTALYFGDPRTWPGVGYPGPPEPVAFRAAYSAQLVDLSSLRAPGGEET